MRIGENVYLRQMIKKDETIATKEKELVERWKEYYQQLLCKKKYENR